jgi:16S rRNA (uracil1498-N3)-methyltransferase
VAAEGAPSFVLLHELETRSGEFAIEGDEAHYLSRVVRVRVGERISATDGRGLVATLEVVGTGASLRLRELARERFERTHRLEIWCGAPEGDRADWLVEKLGELGVAALVPLECSRGRWARARARVERWERLAVAALRQSRSPWRLEVSPPRTLPEAFAAAGAGSTKWLCQMGGPPVSGADLRARPGVSIVAIGPSSGFDTQELKLLSEQGFDPMGLGRSRLRTETAALAVASLWAVADAS